MSAYVDSLSADEIREYRGTLTEPGKNSPYRDRSVEENLDLFRRMRAGEFADGEHLLRAKDRHGVAQHQPARSGAVSNPACRATSTLATNGAYIRCMTLRTLCRMRLEQITHSLCTLEFEDHQAAV